MRNLGYAVLVCGWLMTGALLQAHHSLAGVYDMKAEKEVTGTVEKVQFTNPHGSLSVAVKNEDGTSTSWVLTLGSATALAQRGVGRRGPNALHEGDKVTVKFIPAKDGHPLGFLKAVTYADGHTVIVSGGKPNE